MLVQQRAAACRLITQHQHGLVTGVLGGAWRGSPRDAGLPPVTVLAAGLHDVVWREEDRTPRFDPDRNLPHDFTSLPPDLKRPMVERGLKALEVVEPAVAALVREHHTALLEGRSPRDAEAEWLAFLDVLALRVCLTPPDADREAVPDWLSGATVTPPGGAPLEMRWRTPSVATLSPFPFPEPELVLHILYRELPHRTFRDARHLERAWEAATLAVWKVRLMQER